MQIPDMHRPRKDKAIFPYKLPLSKNEGKNKDVPHTAQILRPYYLCGSTIVGSQNFTANLKGGHKILGATRLRQVISRMVKETLYKSLVLPLVEYGSVLFDNCSITVKMATKYEIL